MREFDLLYNTIQKITTRQFISNWIFCCLILLLCLLSDFLTNRTILKLITFVNRNTKSIAYGWIFRHYIHHVKKLERVNKTDDIDTDSIQQIEGYNYSIQRFRGNDIFCRFSQLRSKVKMLNACY
jgi:uncharacterized membrane protein